MPRLRAITLLSLATSLFVVTGIAQNTNTARPGTINYVEGQATVSGQALTAKSVGSAEVAQGQTVSTTSGKVEVLLTPGVFLRLGENSAVTMISPDLMKTEVQVDSGTAEIEVDQLYKQNDLLVDQGSAQSALLKNGLYEFDATVGNMRVFDGEAAVSPSQDSKKWIKVKGHHDLAMNGEVSKSQGFDAEVAAKQDTLYNWSKLRADYLGQENLDLAEEYAGNADFNPGWFSNSGTYGYTWLPGDGLFWGPFGDGFYSPGYLYGGGFIYPGFGFGGGYYRGGYGFRGPYRGGEGYRGGGGFRNGSGSRGAVTAPQGRGSIGGESHGNAVAGGFHGGGFGGGGGSHGGGGRR